MQIGSGRSELIKTLKALVIRRSASHSSASSSAPSPLTNGDCSPSTGVSPIGQEELAQAAQGSDPDALSAGDAGEQSAELSDSDVELTGFVPPPGCCPANKEQAATEPAVKEEVLTTAAEHKASSTLVQPAVAATKPPVASEHPPAPKAPPSFAASLAASLAASASVSVPRQHALRVQQRKKSKETPEVGKEKKDKGAKKKKDKGAKKKKEKGAKRKKDKGGQEKMEKGPKPPNGTQQKRQLAVAPPEESAPCKRLKEIPCMALYGDVIGQLPEAAQPQVESKGNHSYTLHRSGFAHTVSVLSATWSAHRWVLTQALAGVFVSLTC